MDAALATLLAQRTVAGFWAVRMELRSGPVVCWLDGAAEVTFGGRTYKGRDDTYGTLATLEGPEEGIAVSSPRLRVGVYPGTDAGWVEMCKPENQNSIVYIYTGAVDLTNGNVPTPNLEFVGRLDRVQRGIALKSGTIEIDLSSYWDAMFETGEGYRLNDASHKRIRPSELGCVHVTGVGIQPPWGSETSQSTVVTAGGGGTSGFTGGGSFGGLISRIQGGVNAR